MKTNHLLVCGIDPDITKSGVAIWSRRNSKFIVLTTVDMAGLINLVTSYSPNELRFRVDAGWLNDGLYRRNKNGLPKGFATWSEDSKMAYMVKIGMQIGQNQGIGLTICHFLRANKFDVEECKPSAEKWSAKDFMLYTGLEKGYNEEIRDAAKLVIGL